MINILIADDSETETALLKSLFESEKDFVVVGCAKNGKEAVELNETLKPDIITMDIHMPVMNGFEATRLIMSQQPTPIIVISSRLHDESLRASFQALEAGAVSVLEKPKNFSSPAFAKQRVKIIEMIKVMAGVKVIKRRFNTQPKKTRSVAAPALQDGNYEIIAIGASVGGPQALKTILTQLPADFPMPIVVVQHMTQGFISGFAKWLNDKSRLKVKYAEDHELLQSGTVYFAPDNVHLEIHRSDKGLITHLLTGPPVSGFCPSITTLFQSIATHCGKNAVGVLLTGMGSDGAQGLLAMKQAQAHTFIQDADSAVVFGMAGVAQSLNAADKVIELDLIADYLIKIANLSLIKS